jgi:hypothetical protein
LERVSTYGKLLVRGRVTAIALSLHQQCRLLEVSNVEGYMHQGRLSLHRLVENIFGRAKGT